jgi:hypothetical protein
MTAVALSAVGGIALASSGDPARGYPPLRRSPTCSVTRMTSGCPQKGGPATAGVSKQTSLPVTACFFVSQVLRQCRPGSRSRMSSLGKASGWSGRGASQMRRQSLPRSKAAPASPAQRGAARMASFAADQAASSSRGRLQKADLRVSLSCRATSLRRDSRA